MKIRRKWDLCQKSLVLASPASLEYIATLDAYRGRSDRILSTKLLSESRVRKGYRVLRGIEEKRREGKGREGEGREGVINY